MDPIELGLIWVAAIFTLFVLSFLFKDNPFFKFAEHTAVGAGAGYWVVAGFGTIRDAAIKPLLQGQLLMIVPIALGILMFATYTKWSWVSRYPVAFLIGCGLGVAIRSTIEAQIISQIRASLLPLATGDVWAMINNWILVVGTIAVVAYFLFTRQQKGSFGKFTQFGKVIMMVYFGGAFASITFMYISIMIERIVFLIKVWLGFG